MSSGIFCGNCNIELVDDGDGFYHCEECNCSIHVADLPGEKKSCKTCQYGPIHHYCDDCNEDYSKYKNMRRKDGGYEMEIDAVMEEPCEE